MIAMAIAVQFLCFHKCFTAPFFTALIWRLMGEPATGGKYPVFDGGLTAREEPAWK
jgi:hypothetical protein